MATQSHLSESVVVASVRLHCAALMNVLLVRCSYDEIMMSV